MKCFLCLVSIRTASNLSVDRSVSHSRRTHTPTDPASRSKHSGEAGEESGSIPEEVDHSVADSVLSDIGLDVAEDDSLAEVLTADDLKKPSGKYLIDRAVFTWVSKVICVWVGFVLLRSVIGLKISRQFLSQSEVKPKPIVTRSRTFSRALRQLRVFAPGCDWFTGLSVCFVIGQCNFFDSSFTIYVTQLKAALTLKCQV